MSDDRTKSDGLFGGLRQTVEGLATVKAAIPGVLSAIDGVVDHISPILGDPGPAVDIPHDVLRNIATVDGQGVLDEQPNGHHQFCRWYVTGLALGLRNPIVRPPHFDILAPG